MSLVYHNYVFQLGFARCSMLGWYLIIRLCSGSIFDFYRTHYVMSCDMCQKSFQTFKHSMRIPYRFGLQISFFLLCLGFDLRLLRILCFYRLVLCFLHTVLIRIFLYYELLKFCLEVRSVVFHYVNIFLRQVLDIVLPSAVFSVNRTL